MSIVSLRNGPSHYPLDVNPYCLFVSHAARRDLPNFIEHAHLSPRPKKVRDRDVRACARHEYMAT